MEPLGRRPDPVPLRIRETHLRPLVAANLNPWTDAKVDTGNPQRGPLLIISGEKDHTVPPWAIAHAPTNNKKTMRP